MRVEPAARACDRVDGDGGIRRQPVASAVLVRQVSYVLDELAVGGAQIRAARGSAVIASPTGRGPRVKIFGPREFLANQLGADDDAVACHEAACGLARIEQT